MKIDVQKKGNVNVLSISGNLTLGKGETVLRETFRKLLESGERFFVLDLTSVEQLDSAGIGETVACYKRAAEENSIVKIVVPPEGKLRNVFRISSLDQLFEIFPDSEAAVATF